MIVYGKQIVMYILQQHPDMIEEIYFSKKIDKKQFSQFRKLDKPIILVDNQKAQGLAKGGNHQGYILKTSDYQFTPLNEIKKLDKVVILDEITDVGNIGAIVRTAYSLGYDGLIIGGINTVNMSGVIRSSSAAALDLPICLYKNTQTVANEFKQVDFELIGAHMEGTDIKSFACNNTKQALFLGSEGRGLHQKLQEKLDHKVSIAMENEFDSLNVSVAAGILMHHLGQNNA
ncbi:MAG: 23S rRNA (guanosine(2251)-2'-O)-methyltransferase RlmB [Campylobacterota bacterium]|nr:23S rRNA (guanosine(2251)-2'-O)-methyltransferase RlmB [Campylobacterota bacterium]